MRRRRLGTARVRRRCEQCAQPRIAGDRRGVLELERTCLDARLLGEAVDAVGDRLPRREAPVVVGRAHIEAERHAAGDHVRRAGLDRELAYRRDDALRRAGDRLDALDDLRCHDQWIPAQRHRDGAGMPGAPEQLEARPGAARDRRDHTDLPVDGLDHGSLLDVQLDVPEQIAGRARLGGE